jgi:hypothetical protein
MKARTAAAVGLVAGFVLGWMAAFISALYASKGGLSPEKHARVAAEGAGFDVHPKDETRVYQNSGQALDRDLAREARDYEWPTLEQYIDAFTDHGDTVCRTQGRYRYRCTLPVNHEGPHAAYGPATGELYDTWGGP